MLPVVYDDYTSFLSILPAAAAAASGAESVGRCSPERKARRTCGGSQQSCQGDAGARGRRDDSRRATERRDAAPRRPAGRPAPATERDFADAEERLPTASGARSQTLRRKDGAQL